MGGYLQDWLKGPPHVRCFPFEDEPRRTRQPSLVQVAEHASLSMSWAEWGGYPCIGSTCARCLKGVCNSKNRFQGPPFWDPRSLFSRLSCTPESWQGFRMGVLAWTLTCCPHPWTDGLRGRHMEFDVIDGKPFFVWKTGLVGWGTNYLPLCWGMLFSGR